MLGKSLAYRIDFLKTAKKQLRKIDRNWQSIILDYLEDDISPLKDPHDKEISSQLESVAKADSEDKNLQDFMDSALADIEDCK